MEVWNERHKCYKCEREMVIGITSWGSPHQSIHAVVCTECATPEDLAVPDSSTPQHSEIDTMFSLEKYMKWTPEDLARNEELFIQNNFPTNTSIDENLDENLEEKDQTTLNTEKR